MVEKRLSINIVLLVLSYLLCGLVSAQGRGVAPEIRPGKDVPINVPPRPMYTYQNGKRVDLGQDFSFVVISFQSRPVSRDKRHEFYKNIPLIVSELKEPALAKEGYYVLRLMPGASERAWNIFTEHLCRDRALDYVGRVFKQQTRKGLVDLLATTKRIRIRFKTKPTTDKIDRLLSVYPLSFVGRDDISGDIAFETRGVQLDTVDLVNRIHESGEFVSAEPVFILVKGRPVTPEITERLKKELIENTPDGMREKMEELLRKEREKRK